MSRSDAVNFIKTLVELLESTPPEKRTKLVLSMIAIV